jgi:hypothetical protein
MARPLSFDQYFRQKCFPQVQKICTQLAIKPDVPHLLGRPADWLADVFSLGDVIPLLHPSMPAV